MSSECGLYGSFDNAHFVAIYSTWCMSRRCCAGETVGRAIMTEKHICFDSFCCNTDSEIANFLRSRIRRSRDALSFWLGYAREKEVLRACVRLAQLRVYAQKPRSTFGKTASVFGTFKCYTKTLVPAVLFHLSFLRCKL